MEYEGNQTIPERMGQIWKDDQLFLQSKSTGNGHTGENDPGSGGSRHLLAGALSSLWRITVGRTLSRLLEQRREDLAERRL